MSIPVTQNIVTNIPGVVRLVQGDTKPPLVVNLTNENINTSTGSVESTPLDVSNSSVVLKLRMVGSTEVFDTVEGALLVGYEQADGTLISTAPYNIEGAGGRVIFGWNPESLANAGDVEGEIQVTFQDNSVQSAYNIIKLNIRPQF